LDSMQASEQEGIDATSLGIVLGVIAAIAVVTVAGLFLRKRRKSKAA
jgi:LPXTG-motif cell wall-anchored protein